VARGNPGSSLLLRALESAADLGESEAEAEGLGTGRCEDGFIERWLLAGCCRCGWGWTRTPRPSRRAARWNACGGGLPPGCTAVAVAGGRRGARGRSKRNGTAQAARGNNGFCSPTIGGQSSGISGRGEDVSAPVPSSVLTACTRTVKEF
jgi:hypothetical protein